MKKIMKIFCASLCCVAMGIGLVGCGGTPAEVPPAEPPASQQPSETPETPTNPTPEEPETPPEEKPETPAPEEPEKPVEPEVPTEPEIPTEPTEPEEPVESEEDKAVKAVVETLNAWLEENGLIYVSPEELDCNVKDGAATVTILPAQTEDFEVLEILFMEEPPTYNEAYKIEFNFTAETAVFTISKK